jgi:hypothetical protein
LNQIHQVSLTHFCLYFGTEVVELLDLINNKNTVMKKVIKKSVK